MLKPRNFLLAVVAMLGLAGRVFGDTVVLNDGTKLEGKILKESDTEVVVEIQIGTIKDEQVIKKGNKPGDFKEVIKVQPDVAAWAAVKGYALGEDSWTPGDYKILIDRLKAFTTAFPKSANVAEANTKMAAFEEEKKRVEGGEMKLEGKWIAKEDFEKERLQIEGKTLFRIMQKQAGAGQLTDAMNTFAKIEKQASVSSSFPDAVLLARNVLSSLKPAAERQRAIVKAQMDENKRRLDNLQGSDRSTLETAHKNAAAKTEAAINFYVERGDKWLPLNPSTEKRLETLANKANSEMSVLNRYNVEKMKEAIALVEKTKSALAAEDYAGAEDSYRKANSLWSQYEPVKRLQPQIAEAKIKAVEAKKAAEQAALEEKLNGGKPKTGTKGTTGTTAAGKTEEAKEPEAEAKSEEPSIFTKPAFYVIFFLVVGLTAGGMQFLKSKKKANANLSDF